MELINVKDLIIELKKKGIQLGKGNPYNRLRYYTKIGWLDHMVRKKDQNGIVNGHYPLSVIEKIELIEKLKAEGKDNEEISEILKKNFNRKNSNNTQEINIKAGLESIKEIFLEKFNINIAILLLIVFGFLFELRNYNSLHEKVIESSNINKENISKETELQKGTNTLPSGKREIFINSQNVNENSVIIVTFEGNIKPATNYFISQKILNSGFKLETDLNVQRDVKFNWVIIN